MRTIRVSSATPTMVSHVGWSAKRWRTRRPTGSRPGHIRSAKAALTMPTGVAPAPSPAVNPRPCTMPMPIAGKKPGVTMRKSALGWRPSPRSGRSSISTVPCQPPSRSGNRVTKPAACTPGSALTRSTSARQERGAGRRRHQPRRGDDVEDGDVGGIEPGVHRVEVLHRAGEHRRAGHQQHRQRHLHGDEHPVDPPRSHRADAAGRALLARSPQRPGQQRAHRREGDDDADGHRERQRHREQRPVDGQRVFQPVGKGQPSDQGRKPATARAAPTAAASTDMTTDSVTIWRTSRPRPAPSAARSASSSPRSVVRASTSAATLAQAIARTSSTAVCSSSTAGRTAPIR